MLTLAASQGRTIDTLVIDYLTGQPVEGSFNPLLLGDLYAARRMALEAESRRPRDYCVAAYQYRGTWYRVRLDEGDRSYREAEPEARLLYLLQRPRL